MKPPALSVIELLESRIAPALTVFHPIPDLVPGIGKTGTTLDLANAFDAAGSFRTHLLFTTNYIDPANPGVPQVIEIELFDDKAPVTVANFLRYVNGLAPSDYDGVFFHRAIPGVALQGGGFDVSAPGTHIATDPEVHHEFNALDTERSNVAGTIAMAKTGLGPNTGSSEWFFNLGDNSANFDNQNSGFTVFAKVTQGLNVVNAIAGITKFNFSGATSQSGVPPIGNINGTFSDLPLQNYDPDPDGNSVTPAPTPVANQFVTITHAAVIAPTAANAAGVSYSIASITNATTLAPTDLVTGNLAGQTLQLQYKTGASGVAKVSVTASKAGEADVLEDFFVTLKPNLIATTTNNPFPSLLVPGDKANVSVELTNNSAAPASGNFDVVFSLVKVADADGNPASVAANPIIGTLAGQPLNLASGGKTTLTVPVEIPEKLLTLQGEYYQIIAEVKPAAGASAELFPDDNTTLNSANYRLYNVFGSFGGRTNVAITYADAANHSVTATVTGGGFGQFDPQGVGDLDKLAIYQTTAASSLTVSAPDKTSLSALYIDATIGTAALGDVSVKASFDANGGIKTLTLGDVGDGLATRPFGIGAFPADPSQKVTLTLGQVRDVQFTSAMPVGFFKAVNWIDADTEADVIAAPSIDTLFLTGDTTHNGAFQADLALSGSTPLSSFRLLYNDPANEPAVLLITGGGYSHFTPQRGGPAGALEVLGTSAASIVSLAALHTTTVDSVSIENAVGSVALSGVVVNDDFAALGGLKSLSLAVLGDGTATHTLAISAFPDAAQKAAIYLGRVHDVALTSAMPVSTLAAIEWRDTIAPAEVVTAPSIDTIVVTGDTTHSGVFDPTLSVAGSTAFQTFKLTYFDELDQPITLTVSSGGTGKFTAVGAVAISGTSALSSISLAGSTTGVKTTLDSVLVANPIGSASLANVTLNGGFTARGGIKNLVIGNVGNGIATHTISIGAYANDPTQKTTVTLGKVRDTAFTSAMPISTLTAIDWLDGDASSERITAPAIDAVSITGDTAHRGAFEADLTITGTTKLQSFLVTGSVNSARLQIAGDVGLIRLGGLVKSQILVGVTTLPQTLAAFGAEKHRIDTFKILNTAATAAAMIDSQIAAARFGTISVGKVAPASGVGRFGFIADRIASYQVGNKTAQNLAAPMIFDKRTHYAVKIV